MAKKDIMKKILIFTSGGGGGHISVTHALIALLHNKYHNKPLFIFNDVLSEIDPAQMVLGKKKRGEDFYVWLIRHKFIRTLNNIGKFGEWYYQWRSQKATQLIGACLDNEKPDLVISVIPLVNNLILDACQKRNVPLLHIPTDLNTRTFMVGIKNPDYKKFVVALTLDIPESREHIDKAGIPNTQVKITGLPLRPDFFEEKNVTLIKKHLGVPFGKPVILVLMGGAGSQATLMYAKALSQIEHPAHLLLCTGKNAGVVDQIKKINFPKHITYTIIGFTNRISDLMAISNLFITKSGSVSFCEGIYMNLPMLLDATSPVPTWEQSNHVILKEAGGGDSVKSYKDLADMVDGLLANPAQLKEMSRNLEEIETHRADNQILSIISSLIA